MSAAFHFPLISKLYLDEDLPAIIGLLPPQDEEGEGGGLQLVLVKGEVVNDHRLLVGACELEGWMG